ncbi:glycoside hydrolase family 57 protein [Aulographum hederae CBS 113979]|uniref:Glycoside hydrolase family 57 protein n=1 Tax=Aulographum hederae CBS 113979 TaxID=1176131 RepID=A0A6G1H099_9PEZI|nr:glycoside hydrolase family 57 protein [Aulographum hederae CBS 113979]
MLNLGDDIIDGLPNITGCESEIQEAIASGAKDLIYVQKDIKPFAGIRAGFANVLHMHQPLVPAGGSDIKTAKVISNLRYMLDNPTIGDYHDAPTFLHCYERMGDFIPDLVAEGHDPRITLEYSGSLLFGLRQMGEDRILEKLKKLTCDPKFQKNVEWVGMPWAHVVAPSTPVQDFKYHVQAFQQHFASIFGVDALKRIRGFSPSEMALPNDPDVAYGYIKTLKECGYQWVLIQEHTIELISTGGPLENKYIPHLLVARSSRGDSVSITAIIKTQGSDSKLIGQMQPYYEAQSLSHKPNTLAGKDIPPLVTQVADGENGGVMMNEFPSKFLAVMRESSHTPVPPMNVSEYLEHLSLLGITEDDYPTVQPIMQNRIWSAMKPGDGPERLRAVIEEQRAAGNGFNMEGGSWTNEISWVKGYENLLGPMEKLSVELHEKVGQIESKGGKIDTKEARWRNALFHLLVTQTSCYRYWGQGMWTDFGLEVIRRGREIIEKEF